MKLLRFHKHKVLFILVAFLSLILISCNLSDSTSTTNNKDKGCNIPEQLYYTKPELHPEFQGIDADEVASRIQRFALENRGNEVELVKAKREALRFLGYETQRWTSVDYIKVTDEPALRVAVTFISPSLVRAITLVDWLHDLDAKIASDYPNMLAESLKTFDNTESLTFFILIQTETSISKPILVSPDDINLKNSELKILFPMYSDPYLSTPFNSSTGAHSGFFMFARGMPVSGQCIPTLDTKHETSILLKTENVAIGEHPKNSMSWKIYFPILAKLNSPVFLEDLASTLEQRAGDTNVSANPPPMPPAVFSFSDRNADSVGYIDLGKYIWRSLVMGGLP